jgi:lysozyme family protein
MASSPDVIQALLTALPWLAAVIVPVVIFLRMSRTQDKLVDVLGEALGRHLTPATGAVPAVPSLPSVPPALSPAAPHPVAPPAPLGAAAKPVPAPAPVTGPDNFDACMAFVWPEEGGFSNDPQDHGGPTNLGVTGPDLVRAGMPSSIEDIKALTKPVAAARIYRPFYWNAMHCDELPRGVDLCVFDLGINAGIHEAAKLLQRAVGATEDGVIGPLTIAAARTKPAADIIRTFTEERLAFYRSLKQFDRFGRDWTSRTNHCQTAALKMAGETVTPPLAASPTVT